MNRLKNARVAVFGVGGVGGYVVEALARSGVGTLDLVDNDVVCETNINRQIIATTSTVGKYKVDVARDRVRDINPNITVNVYKTFYLPETADLFDFTAYDYVVDAIDTVKGKIQLILQAKQSKTPVISCMGAGNKVDPSAFRVADIYSTRVCPLAKVMRAELKKRGVKSLKVVYSEEDPVIPFESEELALLAQEKEDGSKCSCRQIPGSTAFVPSVAGLIVAGEVINDLANVRFRRKGNEK